MGHGSVIRVPGVFVTFEGGEGVGKTTQMKEVARRLREVGREVFELREPGGTPVGDRIRALLLEPGDGMDPVTELLLYEASRAEVVREVISPALARGAAVLCDRFTDSTLAYQGYGRGLDLADIRTLNAVASAGVTPDVTILLATDVHVGLTRATQGGADRIEGESAAFHAKVSAGFHVIAADEPQRVLVVDASGGFEEVTARVWAALSEHPALAGWMGAALP